MLKERVLKLIDTEENINKEIIKSLLRSGIGFKIEEENKDFLYSKIGGYPNIQEEQFPFLNGVPLTFIGQIDLSEIHHMNNILPSRGFLCFFISTDNIGYRYPDRKGEFKVLYIEDILQNPKFKKCKPIEEYPISFFEYYTFPSYQENIIKKNNIGDDDLNIMSDIEGNIMQAVNEDFNIPHQLLGYPNALQGTVNFWWAAKYLKINVDNETLEEEIEHINKIEDEFILLLQLNFEDPKIDIDYFGDSIAYFGIHKTDLINSNFDNVILEIQST